MSKFEEEYEDVLQNIEFGIVRVYREHPQMTDYHALSAVEALVHGYHAESQGREVAPASLDPPGLPHLRGPVHRVARAPIFTGETWRILGCGTAAPAPFAARSAHSLVEKDCI